MADGLSLWQAGPPALSCSGWISCGLPLSASVVPGKHGTLKLGAILFAGLRRGPLSHGCRLRDRQLLVEQASSSLPAEQVAGQQPASSTRRRSPVIHFSTDLVHHPPLPQFYVWRGMLQSPKLSVSLTGELASAASCRQWRRWGMEKRPGHCCAIELWSRSHQLIAALLALWVPLCNCSCGQQLLSSLDLAKPIGGS